MLNPEDHVLTNFDEEKLSINHEPPYMENLNKKFLDDFISREAYKIKRKLTFEKVLVNQKKEYEEAKIKNNRFVKYFIKDCLRESLLRLIDIRVYPRIEMYMESMFMFMKVDKLVYYELSKFALIYSSSLKNDNIYINLIDKLLVGSSYDNKIIDSTDIYRYNKEKTKKEENLINRSQSIFLNETSFFTKSYNIKYYNYFNKNISILYLDSLRSFNLPVNFMLQKKNFYLNKNKNVYYVYLNYKK
jgi:hypothetical protein